MACLLFSSMCGPSTTVVNVETICDTLKQRIETQRLQASIYFTQAQEHSLRANLCAKEMDKLGTRQFLLERNKAQQHQRLELKQMSNLLEILEQLERAQRDLETSSLLSGANVSLADLLERIPDLEQIMDDLQDGRQQVMEHSEILATSLVPRETSDALEDEIALLITEAMPTAIIRSNFEAPFIEPTTEKRKCLAEKKPS